MSRIYASLARHTAVYGAGQLFMRLGSVLLLPVYTRYLSPSDYGVIALLDLASALLVIFVGCGIAAAAQRYHFDTACERERSQIWSTALLLVAVPPLPVLAAAWWMRQPLAQITHGTDALAVADLYTLVLATVWFLTLNQTADGYLRTCKRSATSVLINVSGLAFNMALNMYLLIVAGMGVRGVLLGNLIATAATSLVRSATVLTLLERVEPTRRTASLLLRFGAPLAAASMLATGMHQFDHYLLRVFHGLEEVGLYALAYTLSQGAASLALVPFSATWEAIRYEIAQQDDAPLVYARVFHCFVVAMGLLLFAVALFAEEIVGLLAAPDFRGAAAFVPILSLAYLVFSLHQQFSVPAFLHKVPQRTLVSVGIGFATTIVAGLALIPALGAYGAALATLASFTAFSFVGLWMYSKLERYPYPIGFFVRMVAAMALSFMLVTWVVSDVVVLARVAIKAAVWVATGVVLLASLYRDPALADAIGEFLSRVKRGAA